MTCGDKGASTFGKVPMPVKADLDTKIHIYILNIKQYIVVITNFGYPGWGALIRSHTHQGLDAGAWRGAGGEIK